MTGKSGGIDMPGSGDTIDGALQRLVLPGAETLPTPPTSAPTEVRSAMLLTTRTRTIILEFAMGTLLLAAPGCSDSDPTAAPCQSAGTGTLAFRNESSSATLRVLVNGRFVAEVTPGASSQHDVSGGSHIVVWHFQGTHVPACDPATATIAPCAWPLSPAAPNRLHASWVARVCSSSATG
jgi:hypothetical protein